MRRPAWDASGCTVVTIPLRAMTSDLVCGSHPSDLPPRAAWHAGAEDPMHICTCPESNVEGRPTASTTAAGIVQERLICIGAAYHVLAYGHTLFEGERSSDHPGVQIAGSARVRTPRVGAEFAARRRMSIKHLAAYVSVIACLLAPARASAQELSELAVPPNGMNQRAEVSQWIGLVKVTIAYHSPNVHWAAGGAHTGPSCGA